jgi:uncharacterized protein (TIGR01777 family)
MTEAKQTVLVSGASGLIGSALVARLSQRGHTVRTLSRRHGDVLWNTDKGELASDALDDIDCVVHLAGEPIAQRWTASAKQRILDSRVLGTTLLANAILKSATRPTFICASGINIYGSVRSDDLAENSSDGDGFLAAVCRAWENAALPLSEAGIRTVLVRTGIVLSRHGGALSKMLPPFRAGVGGIIGSGQQRMSWISLEDITAIYLLAIEDSALNGAINAVAPEPVTNTVFTKTLGMAIHRPTVFPLPGAVVRVLFGKMGTETILADLGVYPKRLEDIGFEWQHPTLDMALTSLFN